MMLLGALVLTLLPAAVLAPHLSLASASRGSAHCAAPHTGRCSACDACCTEMDDTECGTCIHDRCTGECDCECACMGVFCDCSCDCSPEPEPELPVCAAPATGACTACDACCADFSDEEECADCNVVNCAAAELCGAAPKPRPPSPGFFVRRPL